MDRDQLTEEVRKLIAPRLGLSTDQISDQADFESLGLDSVEAFEMLFLFEDRFGVKFDNEVALSTRSIPQLVQALAYELERS